MARENCGLLAVPRTVPAQLTQSAGQVQCTGYRCFGLYRYTLTYGTLSRSLAHSSWDTLYIYIYICVCVCVYVCVCLCV